MTSEDRDRQTAVNSLRRRPRGRVAALVAVASLTPGLVLAATGTPVAASDLADMQPSVAFASTRSYGVMVRGRSWLDGKGVDVLRGRQCTELASRLYAARRWGSIYNFYRLSPGRIYDRAIEFHRNGSGYVPVPGDVLVELGGSYQHVAVVNRVTRRAIHTVEQNAVPSGRHVYGWNGRRASGAYGPRHVGGFIHSRRNRIQPQQTGNSRPGKGSSSRPFAKS